MTRETLSGIIDKHHPESLNALRRVLEEDGIVFQEEELIFLLKQAGYGGEFTLSNFRMKSFFGFLADYHACLWVHLTVVVSVVELVLVLYNVDASGLSSARAVLGILILGFVPGYSLTRILFPKRDLPMLEKVMMSIFLSVVVSIAIGTLLGAFLLFEAGLNIILLSIASILLALYGAYRNFTLR